MENLNINTVNKLSVKELRDLIPYGFDIKKKKKSELIAIVKDNFPEVVERQRINSMDHIEFLKQYLM